MFSINNIELLFWHWWIIATVLFIAELIISANVFLWMGISAIIIGIINYFIPSLDENITYILFAIFSIINAIGYRIWYTRQNQNTQEHHLNNPSEKYIGQTIILANPIKNGAGREKIGRSIWAIKGNDLPIGSKVKIIKSNSTTLIVEKI